MVKRDIKCPKCKKSDRLFGGTDGHTCERCEITYADAYGREIIGWINAEPILGKQKYPNIIKEMHCEGRALSPYFRKFK